MAADHPLPGTLLYGRTALGENVPVLVDSAGLLAGGGNPFDQDLNTDDDVVFNEIIAESIASNADVSAELIVGTTVTVLPVLFAALPAVPNEGMLASITDANTAVWGANITAGLSTNHVLARYNGSNWTVVGK